MRGNVQKLVRVATKEKRKKVMDRKRKGALKGGRGESNHEERKR